MTEEPHPQSIEEEAREAYEEHRSHFSYMPSWENVRHVIRTFWLEKVTQEHQNANKEIPALREELRCWTLLCELQQEVITLKDKVKKLEQDAELAAIPGVEGGALSR